MPICAQQLQYGSSATSHYNTFCVIYFCISFYTYATVCIKLLSLRRGCDCYHSAVLLAWKYSSGYSDTFNLAIIMWKVIFNFIQYHKEVVRLMSGEFRQKIGDKYISFARKWMNYVLTKCESGRGTRPR